MFVFVFVYVVDLMIPVTDDYLTMTTWITVRGDTERTLTVAVLTGFKAAVWRDHGKAGKLRYFGRCLRWDLIFPFYWQHQKYIFKSVVYTTTNKNTHFHVTLLRISKGLACNRRNGNNT